MNRIPTGKFLKALFVLLISFTFTFAQDENYFLPTATGGSGTGYEENIYLQTNPPPVDNSIRTPAQISNGNLSGIYEGSVLSCPYSFERDLYVGIRGEDVRLLQILLNSDRRTIIAVTGPGSPGQETVVFGQATNGAIKRFQALFIEYIGVANGRFGPRTRTVMNAICNGGNANPASGDMYNNVESIQKDATPQGEITEIPNDKIAPRVTLSANVNTIEVGSTFKVVANFSEPIKSFTPDSIIIDGGAVKEIRKLSPTSYSITVVPDSASKNVTVQIEADKVIDLAANTNENASNEVTVKIIAQVSTNTASSSDLLGDLNIDGILSQISATNPTCTYSQAGLLITVGPNGEQLNTTGCQQSGGTNQQGGQSTYDQTNRCYTDQGALPTGVTEAQRCRNTPAQYDPYRGCYTGTGILPYGSSEYQRCNNANNPYNNPYNNPFNPYSPAGQQAAQNAALGSLLGRLLTGGNSPLNGGNPLTGTNPFTGRPDPIGRPEPTTIPGDCTGTVAEKAACEAKKAVVDSIDGLSGEITRELSCKFLTDSTMKKVGEWTESSHKFYLVKKVDSTATGGIDMFMFLYPNHLISEYGDKNPEVGKRYVTNKENITKISTDGLKCCIQTDPKDPTKCTSSTSEGGSNKSFVAKGRIDFVTPTK